MSVNQQLAAQFPGYDSPEKDADWRNLKQRLSVGSFVKGRVVHREPFGVFLDLGVGFPALILVVRLMHADTMPYTRMDMYPVLGAEVGGRVYVFNDAARQIGVTQQPRESWMEGDW